jgi:hypothetical protein
MPCLATSPAAASTSASNSRFERTQIAALIGSDGQLKEQL